MTPRVLMDEAERARRRAYAPYSDFSVGAALLGASGRIYHGGNVENASFGLTTCAERSAVFTAVSEGERDFVAIAVTAREGRGAPPCGACRQVLHEFAPRLWVCWRNASGRIIKRRLTALLPAAFVFKRARRRPRKGTR
jgi:cytidine deaminase